MVAESLKQLGARGEALVARHLRERGFSILAQNYLIRGGEIDLVAGNDEYVLFVEVKTRLNVDVSLFELISRAKQRAMTKTALHFIGVHGLEDKSYRFDVALIDYTRHVPALEYVENAFCAVEGR